MNLITSPTPISFRDRSIYTTNNARAFCALKDDGSVVTWGQISETRINKITALLDGKIPAKSIYESGNGFGVIRSDGSAVLWRNDTDPIVIGGVQNPVISISSDVNGFAGIYSDGTGFIYTGSSVSPITSNAGAKLLQVCASAWGYAYIFDDGTVFDLQSGKNLNYSSQNWYSFASESVVRVFD